jgi:hypothetical protein
MTAARQQAKRYRRSWLIPAAVAVLLIASDAARTATTELVVTDRLTGLAIGGYDPVAYYTNGKPVLGSGDFELSFAGAVWRFQNPGNRAAFASRPDIYMPQYGGYDPVGVARGTAVAGNPDFWLIYADRLYLFYDARHRDAFAVDPQHGIAAADRKWPEVVGTLSP